MLAGISLLAFLTSLAGEGTATLHSPSDKIVYINMGDSFAFLFFTEFAKKDKSRTKCSKQKCGK